MLFTSLLYYNGYTIIPSDLRPSNCLILARSFTVALFDIFVIIVGFLCWKHLFDTDYMYASLPETILSILNIEKESFFNVVIPISLMIVWVLELIFPIGIIIYIIAIIFNEGYSVAKKITDFFKIMIKKADDEYLESKNKKA